MLTVFLDFGSVTRGDIDRAALEQAVSPWIYHDNTSREQVTERIRELKSSSAIKCNWIGQPYLQQIS